MFRPLKQLDKSKSSKLRPQDVAEKKESEKSSKPLPTIPKAKAKPTPEPQTKKPVLKDVKQPSIPKQIHGPTYQTIVQIIRGENLLSFELMRYCDPYVQVSMNGYQQQKTRTIANTKNPEWNDPKDKQVRGKVLRFTVQNIFCFGAFQLVFSGEIPQKKMTFQLWDERDGGIKPPQDMGVNTLDLSTVPTATTLAKDLKFTTLRLPMTLTDPKKRTTKKAGFLHIKIARIEIGADEMYHTTVKAIEGTELPLVQKRRPNPYVRVVFNPNKPDECKYSSRHSLDNDNPIWNYSVCQVFCLDLVFTQTKVLICV